MRDNVTAHLQGGGRGEENLSNGLQEHKPGSNTILRLTPGFLKSAIGVCRSSEARCNTFTSDVLCDLSLPQIYAYSVCVVTFKIQSLSLSGVQHPLVVPLVGQRWLAAELSVSPPVVAHLDDLCQLVRLKIYWAQVFPQKTYSCVISQIYFELNSLPLKHVGCI